MNKKPLIVISVVILLPVVFLGADYLELFGTSTSTRLDFAVARFKTVDMDTGAPVFGSRVKCQQKGNDNACTLKDTKSGDVLSLLVPKQTVISKSLLFTKNEELLIPQQPNIYIFFINADYETVNLSVPIIDIIGDNYPQKTIKMKARQW